MSLASVSGNGRDAAADRKLTDSIIAAIRDEDIAGSVHEQAGGIVQPRRDGRAPIAVKTRESLDARDGGDVAVAGRYFPDHIIERIRDENIPGGIHGHTGGS